VKTIAIFVVTALVAAAVAYIVVNRRSTSQAQEITTASGLKYSDLVEGSGASPKKGQIVSVKYTGSLINGKVFDSSEKPGRKPLEFPLGMARVIPGWDEAIATMKVGGKRHLIIPPKLGYGASGQGEDIPPNATLIFDIELVGVK